MKYTLIVILFFFLQPKYCGGMKSLNNQEKALRVYKIIGAKDDIKNIFFLAKGDIAPQYSKIIIHYHPFGFTFELEKDLIGLYSVTNNGGLRVNNFNPMRDKVSYRDTTEREYRFKIEQKEDKYSLKFTNYGERYKLSGEVIILAHKDE